MAGPLRALALIALLSCAAVRAEWVPTNGAKDEQSWIDSDSIALRGNYLKAWVMTTFSSDQPPMLGWKAHRSMKALYYFDCDEKTWSVIQVMVYTGANGDGDVAGHTVRPDAPRFQDAVPGSAGAGRLEHACSLYRAKKSGSVPRKGP